VNYNNTEYLAYSQPVTLVDGSYCDVQYFFITIIPSANFQNYIMGPIEVKLDQFRTIAIVVMCCLLLILEFVFMWIALRFSRRITEPITSLTRFTIKMTEAQDRQEKSDVINELSTTDDFKLIAKQYENLFPERLQHAKTDLI